MGTTIVALLMIKNEYFIMNVGDSRAYAISNQVYQLTKDQSLVQQRLIWDGFVRRMRKDIRREMFCYSVSEHRRRFFLIFTGELFCREPFSFCAVMDSGMRSVNRSYLCS